MVTRSAPALVFVLMLASACERGQADTASKRGEPAGPAEPEPKPSPAPAPEPKPAANTFTAPSEAELAEHRAALARHLAAGRAAVKAKDYATGIAELERAAAINPMHAKTLGELGWAYFHADRLDAAQQTLERGLHHAHEVQTRGAILYNLGRVAEAQGRRELAAELYQRSLTVRPNDTVAVRLRQLTGGVEVVGHSDCGWTHHGPAPRQLCPAYLRTLEPGAEDAPECAYERTRPASDESGDLAVPELELGGGEQVFVFSYRDFDEFTEHFIVSVVLGGQWYSSELAMVSHPGVGYADENLDDLELRAEQLSEGGKPEIVIEWGIYGHDIDPGIEMEGFYQSKQLAVLTVEGSEPRWLLGLRTELRRSYGPIDEDDSGPPPVVEAVEIEWTTKTGELELRAATGAPATPLGSFALGTYPLLCPGELE